jgi:hypothetical protein
MILGILLKDPFYLDYKSVGQKNLFSYFPLSGTFTNSKGHGISFASFYTNRRPRELRPHLSGQESQKMIGGAV